MRKKNLVVSGLLFVTAVPTFIYTSPHINPQAEGQSEGQNDGQNNMDHIKPTYTLENIGEFIAPTPPRPKSTINYLSDSGGNSAFRYVHGNGSDLKEVTDYVRGDGGDLRDSAPDAYGRASAVVIIMEHYDGSYYVGSGNFVGSRTILTVAHNFLEDHLDNTMNKLKSVRIVIGSNSPMRGHYDNPTSGVTYTVDKSKIRFFNQNGFSMSSSRRDDKIVWQNDVAAIQVDFPFELAAFKQGLNNNEHTRVAPLSEMDGMTNNSAVVINGYPGNHQVGTEKAAGLARDIYHGKLYRAASNIRDIYPSDNYPGRIFTYHNTSLGGMSGSSVLNDKGNVVGTYNFSTTGGDTPDEEGHAGGVIFGKTHRDWLVGLLNANKQPAGWANVAGRSERFYYDTNGELVRNADKAIDGKVYRFNNFGVASVVGNVNTSKVYVKRIDDRGNTISRREVGVAKTGEPFKYNGKKEYDKESATFKRDWLLVSYNGVTDGRDLTVEAKEGNGDVEIIEMYRSNWKALDRRELNRVIGELERDTKLRDIPTADFNQYTSGGVLHKVEDLRKRLDAKLKEAKDMNAKTDADDKKVWRNQSEIDKLVTALTPFKKEIDDVYNKYKTFKDTEKSGLRNKANDVRNYFTSVSSKSTRDVKKSAVDAYEKAKNDLRDTLSNVERFTNDRSIMFKSKEVSDKLADIEAKRKALEAAVKGLEAEVEYSNLEQLKAKIGELDVSVKNVPKGTYTETSRRNYDTAEASSKNVLKQANDLVNSKPVKSDQVRVDRMVNEVSASRNKLEEARKNLVSDELDKALKDKVSALVDKLSKVKYGEGFEIRNKDENKELERLLLGNYLGRDVPDYKTKLASITRKSDFDRVFTKNVIEKLEKVSTLSDKIEQYEIVKNKNKTPFTTRYIDDNNMEQGKQTVVTEGRDGEFEITVKRWKKDGVEELIATRVLSTPIQQVVRRGTMVIGSDTETTEEDVKYTTEYVNDDEMDAGIKKVVTKGENGRKKIIKRYVTQNGRRVGLPEVKEEVIKQPVKEIVHVGTKGSDKVVERVDVPFTTKKVEDETLKVGLERIITQGINGQKEITKLYKTISGKRVGEPTITEKVIRDMVEKVIHVGVLDSKQEVETVDVPFTIEEIDDDNLEVGKTEMYREGKVGKKEITKTYKVIKGQVVGEPVVTEKVVTHAVNKVVRVGTKGAETEVSTKDLPFETKYIYDGSMLKGESKVESEGKVGKVEVTKIYTLKKGKRVGEPRIVEKVIEEKVDKVVRVGILVKKDEPKVETPKAETPKAEAPKVEVPKVDIPKESPKESPHEQPKEAPKVEVPKTETPKAETPKESPKVETPKVDTPHKQPKEQPKIENPKEAPKVDTPKESPKDAPREQPKETPKEQPKVEDPKGGVNKPKIIEKKVRDIIDPTLPKGQVKVLSEGRDGEVVTQIIDGKKVDVIKSEPIDKVVIKGGKELPNTGSNETYAGLLSLVAFLGGAMSLRNRKRK